MIKILYLAIVEVSTFNLFDYPTTFTPTALQQSVGPRTDPWSSEGCESERRAECYSELWVLRREGWGHTALRAREGRLYLAGPHRYCRPSKSWLTWVIINVSYFKVTWVSSAIFFRLHENVNAILYIEFGVAPSSGILTFLTNPR